MNSEFGFSIFSALLKKETELREDMPKSGECFAVQLTASQRKKVVKWMKEVTDFSYFALDCNVLFAATCMFDRFVIKKSISLSDVQKYAIACMFIATKIVGSIESKDGGDAGFGIVSKAS